MGTSTTRTVEPTIEPITLAEAKTQLNEYGSQRDAEIYALIKEAREHVEQITGRALITQTWEMKLDSLPTSIKVPHPPLQSVTSIQYQDASDVTQTLASSEYSVDTSAAPGRIVQAHDGDYPAVLNDINVVTITYIAGYGSAASDVPEVYKRAMKLYIDKVFDMPPGDYMKSLDNTLEFMLLSKKIDWIAL